MQYSQTRYVDTINPGINNSALSLTAGTTPPTRTQGILTIGRLQSNTEDVYYTNVAGNVVTIALRGLSQTALTLTSVVGNQKVHNANESLEMTTHHAYDVNKVRIDENETISGVKTFSGVGNTFSNAVKLPGLLDANGNETITTPATASAVNELTVQNAATGNNVILTTSGGDANINLELQAKGSGVVIIEDGGQMKTNASPVNPQDIANKQYVDNAAGNPLTLTAGENITQGDALYIKSSDGKVYKTDASAVGEAVENFIGFAATTVTTNNSVVVLTGNISGLTGKTAGSTYFLTNTPGVINTAPGTITKPVLIATSSTGGVLFPTQAFRVFASTTSISAPGIGASTNTTVTCGFRPKWIEVWLELGEKDSGGANIYIQSCNAVFNGTTLLSGTFVQWYSGGAGTAETFTGILAGSASLSGIYTVENAVKLTPGFGANRSNITFSVSAISATGATFQLTNTIANGTGSTNVGCSTITYKIHG